MDRSRLSREFIPALEGPALGEPGGGGVVGIKGAVGSGLRRLLMRERQVIVVYGLFVVVLAVNGVIRSDTLSAFGILSLSSTAVPYAFAALAQMAALVSRGVDLSVGSQIALVNVVAATTMSADPTGGYLVAIGILGMATAVGAVTGWLINATRIPDIIVTLGTSSILEGLALAVLPNPGGSIPSAFANPLSGAVVSIPVSIIVLIGTSLVIWWPIRRSKMGLEVYALGSDPNAARLSGANIRRAKIIAYSLDGLFCGFAGLLLSAQSLGGDATIGAPYTLNSIAAGVVGGVLLAGGRGTVLGVIGASFFLTDLANLLFFLGLNPNYQVVLQGAILIIVLALVRILNRRSVA